MPCRCRSWRTTARSALRGPATARCSAKVYVKVYARRPDGSVKFYKDGYTDLRGRFDYVSLSTNELEHVERFSLLVLSDELVLKYARLSPRSGRSQQVPRAERDRRRTTFRVGRLQNAGIRPNQRDVVRAASSLGCRFEQPSASRRFEPTAFRIMPFTTYGLAGNARDHPAV